MALLLERNGEPIPGYRLVSPIGRGGFGEVWEAEAPGGIRKAIKFVFGDLDSLSTAAPCAEQELKSLARVKGVRHPFLLSVERFDIVEGQLAIVMELADSDLWRRFREFRNLQLPGIPRADLLRYLTEAAEVLDLMNQKYDLQHMDIKPQNLCLMQNHVKVADFGLVKDLTGWAASVTGGLTPKYAPPETFLGRVSRFSDQYSLAVVYQELLTGRGPFRTGNLHELMLQHTEGQPNLEPLPETDRAVVGRALSKDPNQRHPTCLAFLHALQGNSATGGDRGGASPALPDLAQISTNSSPPFRTAEATHSMARADVPEKTGKGVLFPALVVGLGGFGLQVLRQLRKALNAQTSVSTPIEHVQLLGIDTDPDSTNLVLQGSAAEALGREEVLVARLARAGRYSRPVGPLPQVEEWLPPKTIYRIPRNLLTAGHRALGRLAFVDHYRTITAGLKRALTGITTPEVLQGLESSQNLRSNWPRVYVVTSLAGGTGSGMFIDLAYTVRAALREQGYSHSEVIGLFLLPPGEGNPGATPMRANTFAAALVELEHFTAGAPFQAMYEAAGRPTEDSRPPFNRTVLLTVSPGNDIPHDPAETAGNYLQKELLTPLGRETQEIRLRESGTAGQVRELSPSGPSG